MISQAFSWEHGVFLGAALKSEATAAAEHKGKMVMHDPFSMRPFFGYNFGHYLAHWLSLNKKEGAQMPNIFISCDFMPYPTNTDLALRGDSLRMNRGQY